MGTSDVLRPALDNVLVSGVVRWRTAPIGPTAVEADDEAPDDEHLVRVGRLGEAHERRAQHARHVVEQQSALPGGTMDK